MKDNTIIQQCLEILKKENIRRELKTICNPAIEFILLQIRPYIYIIISLIFLIFIMILAILILLFLILRNYKPFTKNQ
jgi:hypothetical protein